MSTRLTSLSEQIDALLPQTQCGLCGHKGCQPYAAAMAQGQADINRCPPGGDETIADLARLLNVAVKPLDVNYGVTTPPAVALIDEAWCIGCTLCIQACPVDAIVGAAKVMHTVIANECTGCKLCIAPCPVDCIQMIAVERAQDREARLTRANHWRRRYQSRQNRLGLHSNKTAVTAAASINETPKQAAVQRALARAQARLTQKQKID